MINYDNMFNLPLKFMKISALNFNSNVIKNIILIGKCIIILVREELIFKLDLYIHLVCISSCI